jgi:hypothetical protein
MQYSQPTRRARRGGLSFLAAAAAGAALLAAPAAGAGLFAPGGAQLAAQTSAGIHFRAAHAGVFHQRGAWAGDTAMDFRMTAAHVAFQGRLPVLVTAEYGQGDIAPPDLPLGVRDGDFTAARVTLTRSLVTTRDGLRYVAVVSAGTAWERARFDLGTVSELALPLRLAGGYFFGAGQASIGPWVEFGADLTRREGTYELVGWDWHPLWEIRPGATTGARPASTVGLAARVGGVGVRAGLSHNLTAPQRVTLGVSVGF